MMDIGSIAQLAAAMAGQRTADAVGMYVLKKALEAQSGGALALLGALPAPAPAGPSHLGSRVDTTA